MREDYDSKLRFEGVVTMKVSISNQPESVHVASAVREIIFNQSKNFTGLNKGLNMRKMRNYLAVTVLFTLLFICAGPVAIVSGSENGLLPNVGEGTGDQVVADFFYNPTCESCQKVLPFIQQYEANSSRLSVNYLNIAVDNASSNRFTEMQKNLGHVHVPFVLIGNQYLVGQDNIIKNLDSLIKTSPDTVISPGSPLREFGNVSSSVNQNKNGIQFFFDPSCGSCQKILPFIELYAKSHPDTAIEFNDISSDPANHQRLEQIKTKYPQDKIYVPVVFIGDTYLQGEANITSSFNSTVESYLKNNPSKKPSQIPGISEGKITALPTSSSLNPQTSISPAGDQDLDGIHFFYNPTCTSCMKVLPVIQDYTKNNPGVNIVLNDIAADKAAIQRFEKMRSMFPQATIYAPAVLVGKKVLQGEANITKNLNTTVEAYLKENPSNGVTDQKSSSSPVDMLISYIETGLNSIFGKVKG